MLSMKIRIRALAACLLLLLAVPSPCVAQEPLSEFLPVGAQARLGQGTTATVQYSPDGTLLAVGGSVGIWLYDAQTHEAVSLLTDHGTGSVSSLAFSPNGQILASDGPGHTVILQEVSTGTLQHILKGHTNWIYGVAFSPDGQTLASGGGDGTVRLWDTATGTLRHTLRGHATSVWSIAFSPDGQTLASGGGDGTVRLWDTATGTLRHSLEGHTASVRSVAFSPDGQTLASGSGGDGTVRLWDMATGTLRHSLESHTDFVRSVAFSPDGQTLASGDADGTVRLWDMATSTLRHSLEGHTASVRSVAFSPDGQTLASSGWYDTVRLWDTATSTLRHSLEGHTASVRSVAFSPDGQTLASIERGTVRLWDMATSTLRHTLESQTDRLVRSVAFSPDGQTLASADDIAVHLWNVVTGTLQHTLENHVGASVAFSPDGQTLASGSWGDTVLLWDVTTATRRHILEGHQRGVENLAFSPDGQTLASGDDETVRLWNVVTGTLQAALPDHTGALDIRGVNNLVFSPDGQTLASSGSDGTFRLWSLSAEILQRTYRLQGHTFIVRSLTFSPDGQTVASAGWDKTIRLWDVTTGTLQHTLKGHRDGINSVAFSPDGRTLAGDYGSSVRLWDTATGLLQHTLEGGHTSEINSVAFSPDGRTLASASWDGTIVLWTVAANSASDDELPGIEPATSTQVGQILASRLAAKDAFDNFTVSLQAGTHYRIEVLLGSLDASVLTLFGPDSREVASNDDLGNTPLASRLDHIAAMSGTYTVQVAGLGSSMGSYKLRITSVPPKRISSSQYLTSNLATRGAFDYYTVSLRAGTHYRIEVSLWDLDDSVLTLFGPDGREVASNDDLSNASFASRIDYTPALSGTYTVKVEGQGSSTGTYGLSFGMADSTSIRVGQTLAGDLASLGTFDHFTVSLQANTRYRIEVLQGSLEDPLLTLFDPDGGEVASNDRFSDGSFASHIDYTPAMSGTYTVKVTDSGSSSGSYRLRIGAVRSIPILVGQTLAENPVGIGTFDHFTVSLQANTHYRIKVVLDSLDESILTLFDPYGKDVASNDDFSSADFSDGSRTSRIDYTAAMSGTYTIGIAGSGSGTGSYRLRIDAVPSTSIRVGQTLEGNLASRGAFDHFTVSLQAGTYHIEVLLDSLDDPVLTLFDPDGREVASNDNPNNYSRVSLIKYTAETSGTYTVKVAGYGRSTGSYRLQINAVRPTTLRVGQTLSGNLLRGTSENFTVPLQAGTHYRIEILRASLDFAVLTLFDPDGRKTASSHDWRDHSHASLIDYTAATSGIYTVKVAGYGRNTGTYRLRTNAVPSTPIRVGQTLAGNLAGSGAFDSFPVSLQADTHYRIEVLLDSLDDSVLTLFDPDGREVASNNDFRGDDFRDASYGSLIDYTAATSGIYTVKVAGYGSKTGTYRLRIGAGGSTPIQVGQTLAGNWAAKGTLDHFTVPLQADTHYRIEVLLDSLDVSVLTLFDPNDREVASNDNRSDDSRTFHIDYTAAAAGSYTVKVAGYGDSTGSYRLRIGTGPSTPMRVGQTLASNLTAFNYFTVPLQAGTGYRIEVLLDSLDDSVLTLFDPDGRKVASNDDFRGTSHASRIDYTAVTSGTYTISVAGSDSGTGSYRLRIDPVRYTLIQIGQTLAGDLAASGMFDYFTVPLQAGTGYRIEVLLDSLDDSVLTLFDPDGREVASNDDFSGTSYASRIDYTAATSGTYTIGVTGSDSGTGSYRLRIDAVRFTPMQVGQPLAARFPARGAFDYFTVSLQANTHYRIELLLDSMDVSVWTLFDPDGREVASNDDFSGNGFSDEAYASRSDYITTTSGTYTIGVSGSGSGTGSYQLSIDPVPSTPTRIGQTLEGNLAASNTFDHFTVPLEADTHYRVEVLLDSLDDSVLTLFDPNGRKTVSNHDFSDASGISHIIYTTAMSGTYTIQVAGSGASTGSYRLRIDPVPSTSMRAGQTLASDLVTSNTFDYFTVPLQAGMHYHIEVLLDSLDDSVLTLFDPDGREVASNDDFSGTSYGSRIDYPAAPSGTYTVKVAGYGASTGSYRLRIDAVPSPSMRVGQTLEGNLAASDAFDHFTVPLEAGTHYRVEVLPDSLDASILTLFDPDGREVAFSDASYGSHIDLIPVTSGTYTVKVAGYGSRTGSYRLRIDSVPSTSFQVGQTLAGNLVASNTFDRFTVSLQTSTHYRVEVLPDSLDASILTLFDPDGREVASNDDFSNASHASRIDYTAAMSGTYTVKVAGHGTSTGSYRLRIDAVPSTPMGTG